MLVFFRRDLLDKHLAKSVVPTRVIPLANGGLALLREGEALPASLQEASAPSRGAAAKGKIVKSMRKSR
jgi:hypothetical protein